MPEFAEGVTSGTLTQAFIHDQPAGSHRVKNISADAALHANAAACLSSDNMLANFYSGLSISFEMSTSWLNPSAYTYLFHNNKRERHPLTILYRASSTDIWSVIPAFPDNSAPIPRARPPKPRKKVPVIVVPAKGVRKRKALGTRQPKLKPVSVLIPKPTPIQQCSPSIRERALLSYIIQYTQDFTVGPLDYCGIARRIKGRGDDVIMYCKGDPRVSEFYHRRHVLAVATAKLKSRGDEKKGLATKTLAAVNRKVAKVSVKVESTVEKENGRASKMEGTRKKRHSADRDMAAAGLTLAPRKRRKLY
ncbi:hypothetical protein DFH09DRAFT_1277419 [Mycena vulgaris]|nr:hypothetical protein DFH09DRAFT_1277419 [Mycena vulgaris]